MEYDIEKEDSDIEEKRKFQARVHQTIDGDTIDVFVNGKKERIRLIGVDAPETGFEDEGYKDQEHYAEEAKMTTLWAIQGKEIELELDVMEADPHGRVQAWIWYEGKLLQETLIREGHAIVATFPPNVKYVEQLIEVQKEARENKRGLWAIEMFDHPPEEVFGLDLTNTNLEIAHRNVDFIEPQQFNAIRKDGLGASDMSVVLHANPYKDHNTLLADKLTPQMTAEDWEIHNKPNVKKGRELENLILMKTREHLQHHVWKPKDMYYLKDYPFIQINYDGVMGNYLQYYPVEIKFISTFGMKPYNFTKAFFREGIGFQEVPQDIADTDLDVFARAEHYGIPVMYYIQLQTQMYGLKAPFGYVAVLTEKFWDSAIFHVWADPKIQTQILLQGFKFWQYVLTKKNRTYEQWVTHRRSFNEPVFNSSPAYEIND